MSNTKKCALMDANVKKAAKLDELGIQHAPLLSDEAINASHREQGVEFDRLLTKPTDADDDDEWVLEDPEPSPTPTSSVDPPAPPADQPAEPAPAPEPSPTPVAIPTPAPTVKPDETALAQMGVALKESQKSVSTSKQLILELQKKLEEIKQQNDEVVMLRKKLAAYKFAETKWNEELQKQRQECTDLRKKNAGHKLTDDPNQVVCLLKEEHDEEFVARAGQTSRWWKWGCISSLIALLCTIVLWLAVSFWSDASTKTTEPPTSDLNLDFPALKELK